MTKEIKGFENLYTIDEYGNVYSIRNKKYLKKTLSRKGYYQVHLRDTRKHSKTCHVHRLVAETFIPNDDPINKTTVDHINGDKTNNHISNLRWLSNSENSSLGNQNKDCSFLYKPIKAIKIETQEEYIFKNHKECCVFTGCTQTDISSVLNGRQKTSHGYFFVAL